MHLQTPRAPLTSPTLLWLLPLAGLLSGISACPSPEETCNGVDDDGDGAVDEDFDQDGDGFGDDDACPDLYGGDCDDQDPAVHAGAPETEDGVDNNCNGAVDEDRAYEVVHALNEARDEGDRIYDGLALDRSGALHGGTRYGGANGEGVFFRVTPSGVYEVTADLGPTPGCGAAGAPVEGPDGWFYAVTRGDASCGANNTLGTVVRFRPGGAVEVLHTFSYQEDGANPAGGLLLASDGAFYGTTQYGGHYTCTGSSCAATGGGILYRVQGRALTVLRVFGDTDVADTPVGALVEGPDGSLYGVTRRGGSGDGTVYRVRKDGGGFVLLHAFDGDRDGQEPMAGPRLGPDGRLYGVCSVGGTWGDGTLWRVDGSGAFEVLHALHWEAGDLYFPMGQPHIDGDGTVWGTTAGEVTGGMYVCEPRIHGSCGGIFRWQEGIGYETVTDFRDDLYSRMPYHTFGGLVPGADGALYGGSVSGGDFGVGAVYRVEAP